MNEIWLLGMYPLQEHTHTHTLLYTHIHIHIYIYRQNWEYADCGLHPFLLYLSDVRFKKKLRKHYNFDPERCNKEWEDALRDPKVYAKAGTHSATSPLRSCSHRSWKQGGTSAVFARFRLQLTMRSLAQMIWQGFVKAARVVRGGNFPVSAECLN